MKLGILGLPGVGKSTLFDLLTESFKESESSGTPNKPRFRTVKVRDARLERLERDYKPKKYTPASFELYDFPAVVKDGNRSGLADLLAPARRLDALFIVVRDFDSRGQPAADSERELVEVGGELILADLVVVERRLDRLEEKSRKPNFTDDDRKEQELLGRVRKHLEEERPLSTVEHTEDERKRLGGFGFLSAKPAVIVVNIGEGPKVDVDSLDTASTHTVMTVSALNELEILRLPPDEQKVFLEEYGIEKLTREPLIGAGYAVAGRISFFTAGEKEVRAWTVPRVGSAVDAAGAIHTDMARGFIRAEVVGFDDYVKDGGVKGAKEKGHFRLEGKEYIVEDGDIVEFRFSV